jgi:NTE family protein
MCKFTTFYVALPFRKYLIILIGLAACINSSHAQKVALVLSGGGARGFAHIGVLKAFDEHHIPIDCIVGTSMGAVVGALYAAGMTPRDMEELALSKSIQEWAAGDLPSRYKYYFTRKEDNASWITLKVSIDSLATVVNPNIMNDEPVNMILAELLARASQQCRGNFDSLMIPFRCMAADVFTQQKVMFKSGDLVDAVRASMSVPMFMPPIKVDNRYLFDGGVYNNFPVDVATEEFHPDFIIGVNVSGSNFTHYPYNRDDQLLPKILYYLLISKSDSTLIDSIHGVYVEPNLSSYTALDFSRAKDMINIGYAYGLMKVKEIQAKLNRSMEHDTLVQKRAAIWVPTEQMKIEKINVTGLKPYQSRYAKRVFRIRKKQEYVNIHEIKRGYYKLAGDDNFQVSAPRFVLKPNGNYDFNMKVKQDKSMHVDLGGNFTSRSINQLFVGFQYNYVNRLSFNLVGNFYSGRFYQSAQVKARVNFPVSKPFYIEPEFCINDWDYFKTNDIINIDKRIPTYVEQVDRKAALNVAFPLSRKFKFEISGAYVNNHDSYSNYITLVSTDVLDATYFEAYSGVAAIRSSTLNRKMYASQGGATLLSLRYVDGTETHQPGNTSVFKDTISQTHQWVRIRFTHEQYFGSGAYRWGYLFEGVLSDQPFFRTYTASVINAPAFYPLQDSRTLMLTNFRAYSYFAGGLRNVIRLRSKIDLRLEGYLFQPVNNIIESPIQRPSFGRDFPSPYKVGSIGVVYHSPIGPVSTSLNYYDDLRKQLGFLFHVGYLIFNPRSLGD